MKRRNIIALACAFSLFLLSASSSTVFAHNGELSWFCIRSGSRQPPITKEEKLINKYGAVSLDRNVNDNSERKVIYLTFDAGYANENVSKILDALNDGCATGAFFILDNIILKNPEIVTRMANEGHLVCNHTRNHKNLVKASREEIYESVSSLERIYTESTGLTMEKLFRFPEGRYSEEALSVLNELGYKTVFWSFAYDDWDNARQPKADLAIQKILNNTHNGAIFLFHPTSKTNAEIFPTLIEEWRAMGYEFGNLKDIKV